jgi:hypothetical protein
MDRSPISAPMHAVRIDRETVGTNRKEHAKVITHTL